MSTIQDLFQQAQLTEAAYANFWNTTTNSTITDPELVTAALIASGFSSDPNNPAQSAQATAFVTQWRVVDQQPNTASGFSATVFEKLDASGTGTGQYTFAVRGSENFWSVGGIIDWFSADFGQIGRLGVELHHRLTHSLHFVMNHQKLTRIE